MCLYVYSYYVACRCSYGPQQIIYSDLNGQPLCDAQCTMTRSNTITDNYQHACPSHGGPRARPRGDGAHLVAKGGDGAHAVWRVNDLSAKGGPGTHGAPAPHGAPAQHGAPALHGAQGVHGGHQAHGDRGAKGGLGAKGAQVHLGDKTAQDGHDSHGKKAAAAQAQKDKGGLQ